VVAAIPKEEGDSQLSALTDVLTLSVTLLEALVEVV
jgi:hypothetical protein